MKKKIIGISIFCMLLVIGMVPISSLGSNIKEVSSEGDTLNANELLTNDDVTVEIYVKDTKGEPIKACIVNIYYGVRHWISGTDEDGYCKIEDQFSNHITLRILLVKTGYRQETVCIPFPKSGETYSFDITLKKTWEGRAKLDSGIYFNLFEKFFQNRGLNISSNL